MIVLSIAGLILDEVQPWWAQPATSSANSWRRRIAPARILFKKFPPAPHYPFSDSMQQQLHPWGCHVRPLSRPGELCNERKRDESSRAYPPEHRPVQSFIGLAALLADI
jgi:hypothetical protein